MVHRCPGPAGGGRCRSPVRGGWCEYHRTKLRLLRLRLLRLRRYRRGNRSFPYPISSQEVSHDHQA